MISKTLTPNITNITEVKKNPVKLSTSDETCVLSNGKPCFYSLSPERMGSLLNTEKSVNDLEISLYTTYDCAVSALDMVNEKLNPDLFYLLEQIIICSIGEDEFNKIKMEKGSKDVAPIFDIKDVIKYTLLKRKNFLISNTKTYVVIKKGTSEIKIGKSTRVDSRINEISHISGCELETLFVLNSDIESCFHRKFKHLRVIGEWFNDDNFEIRNFIENGEQWIIEKFISEGLV